MAEDEAPALDLHFVIVPHALPAGGARDPRRIVIAAKKVLASGEPGKERRHVCKPPREISKMPNVVVLADALIPAADQSFVHRGDGGERTLVDVERAVIAEMRVAGEENGHDLPTLQRRRRCLGSRAQPVGRNRRRSGSKVQR